MLVRSSKAFSGYEGVVASQNVKGNKWEVYYIHTSGYGRKRRRVGDLFDTPDEAARAYAVECRNTLQQERANEDGDSGDDAGGGRGSATATGSSQYCAACATGKHVAHTCGARGYGIAAPARSTQRVEACSDSEGVRTRPLPPATSHRLLPLW